MILSSVELINDYTFKIENFYDEDKYIYIDKANIGQYFYGRVPFKYQTGTLKIDNYGEDIADFPYNYYLCNHPTHLPLCSTDNRLNWTDYNYNPEFPKDEILDKLNYHINIGAIRIPRESYRQGLKEIENAYNDLNNIFTLFEKKIHPYSINEKLMSLLNKQKKTEALELIKYYLNGKSAFFHRYYLDYLFKFKSMPRLEAASKFKLGTSIPSKYYKVYSLHVWPPNTIGAGSISLTYFNVTNKKYYTYNHLFGYKEKSNHANKLALKHATMSTKDLRVKLLKGFVLRFFYKGLNIAVFPPALHTYKNYDFSLNIFINGKLLHQLPPESQDLKTWYSSGEGDEFKNYIFELINPNINAIISKDSQKILTKYLYSISPPAYGETFFFKVIYNKTGEKKDNHIEFLREFSEYRARIIVAMKNNCSFGDITSVTKIGIKSKIP